MYLYIKQRVFSWRDAFSVYDKDGNEKYIVKGEILSIGKKLHIYDMNGNEEAFVEQRLLTFLPKYNIYRLQTKIAEVAKEFTFMRPKYHVNGLGWKVEGDFMSHEYTITNEGRTIAAVCKKWFTIGDAYEIATPGDTDVVNVLSVVIAIDAVMYYQNAAAFETFNN